MLEDRVNKNTNLSHTLFKDPTEIFWNIEFIEKCITLQESEVLLNKDPLCASSLPTVLDYVNSKMLKEFCGWKIIDMNGLELSPFIWKLYIHSYKGKYSTCNDLFKFKMYSLWAQPCKQTVFELIQTY